MMQWCSSCIVFMFSFLIDSATRHIFIFCLWLWDTKNSKTFLIINGGYWIFCIFKPQGCPAPICSNVQYWLVTLQDLKHWCLQITFVHCFLLMQQSALCWLSCYTAAHKHTHKPANTQQQTSNTCNVFDFFFLRHKSAQQTNTDWKTEHLQYSTYKKLSSLTEGHELVWIVFYRLGII